MEVLKGSLVNRNGVESRGRDKMLSDGQPAGLSMAILDQERTPWKA